MNKNRYVFFAELCCSSHRTSDARTVACAVFAAHALAFSSAFKLANPHAVFRAYRATQRSSNDAPNAEAVKDSHTGTVEPPKHKAFCPSNPSSIDRADACSESGANASAYVYYAANPHALEPPNALANFTALAGAVSSSYQAPHPGAYDIAAPYKNPYVDAEPRAHPESHPVPIVVALASPI